MSYNVMADGAVLYIVAQGIDKEYFRRWHK